MFPPTLLTGDQLFQLNRNEHAFIVEIFKKKKKKKPKNNLMVEPQENKEIATVSRIHLLRTTNVWSELEDHPGDFAVPMAKSLAWLRQFA